MIDARAAYMMTETIAVIGPPVRRPPVNTSAHKSGGTIAVRNPTVVSSGLRFPRKANAAMTTAAVIHTHPSSFSSIHDGRYANDAERVGVRKRMYDKPTRAHGVESTRMN